MLRNLKLFLWRCVATLPLGKKIIRWRLNYIQRKRFTKIGDAKEVFRNHYRCNNWDNTESVSGPGSTLAYTKKLRQDLPELLHELNVKTLLDAPCGDYNWMRHIEWKSPIRYIGADIVDELIAKNSLQFAGPQHSFHALDITHDALPLADLWLCRDCLFHLSNKDIFTVLKQFAHSEIPYLLTSTHPECTENFDIPTGSFRLLNLQLPPFNLTEPDRWIDDWIDGQPMRKLGLWTRKQVSECLRPQKR